MKRVVLFLGFVLLFASAVVAEERANLLQQFQQNLAELGRYRVEFRVAVEGYNASGEYIVDGRDFYMTSDSVALYVAGGVKHEVNMRKREVTVDTAANLGSDLISNPVDAFALLARDFDVEEVAGNRKIVELKERGRDSGDRITVEADSDGRLPKRILYRSGGSTLSIELVSATTYAKSLPRYDGALYAGYEVVDFRE
ncbi:MAG: hypothetical protein IKC42_04925 [Alistipes sp.]|nr:hypothetical protein [Alistipes sp.]